ncbi:KEOPS complex subunit Pcc1 [Thermococcus celer]|uniref:KEOPS complex subunit n=1 Tax=Thermococcus celer Vu 13 = JCM 8558 TaxID=1293037 RepID=A0A218P0Q5_THECE|nr:KEOPS complex subunit Pcc1 [Thermococcus celer]ASI98506.1 KEOPS complex subunit [Thermococcus celer Vu 13 = JCM 8558]
MRIEAKAEIVWHYGEATRAEAIAEALEVDNANLPDGLKKSLNVITRWEDGDVITKVKYSGEIETLIKALDDLVFSVKIAEDVTENV